MVQFSYDGQTYGQNNPTPVHKPYVPPPTGPAGLHNVTPLPAPPPPTSGGGSGVGSGSFIAGVRPGGRQGGNVHGPQLPSPFAQFLGGGTNTGISFDETQQALRDQQARVDQLFGRQLGIDTGRFGSVGSFIQDLLGKQHGFSDEAMRLARTRIAEREAGNRRQQLERLSEASSRAGFGGPRVADYALRESLRGQSGQRIADQELALENASQQLRSTNMRAALAAALQAAGIDAGLLGQHAGITASAFNPLAAGGGGAGTGGMFSDFESLLPTEPGQKSNRLPGESLADQLRREAAARQAAYATPGMDLSHLGWTSTNRAPAFTF